MAKGVGAGHLPCLLYEQMFEDLAERQLQQLEKVWTTAAKSVHWRENLRYEMSKALATGCTLDHLAAATGFDQTIEQLRHEPRIDFNGRHPTDRNAPGQEQFYR
jgi:hypothetical protein